MIRTFLIALLAAQTVITPPDNKYSPAEDVKLGQEAAAQAEQQLPIMRDDAVTSYVEALGRRLADAVPENRRHPEFRYSFKVVNVREINAFALPGGPMFVNRGMIEAARNEGEVAGVMAHELSHVVLRHGTAQASKAT
jgi:predicted Zn-dependent protease